MQLIQLKGLLLVREMDEDTGCFMVSLLAICRKISKLDGGADASAAFDEVTTDLQRMIDHLARGSGV